MIKTFYLQDTLDSPEALALSLVIGMLFGFVLERAGFGSSRKLAGVFYFTDMTVIKVMFTAVITTMLGLAYLGQTGWLGEETVYWLPTVYGAQIAGGLIFGIGFVIGGWCPGTAAAGLGSAKLDALLFLVGAVIGSIGFNAVYTQIEPLYRLGSSGVLFVYDSLGMSRTVFVFGFVVIGILCFAVCEWIERNSTRVGHLQSGFVQAFGLVLILLAACLFFIPGAKTTAAGELTFISDQ
ncbi:DUF6691 family protein, partial [Planctomycetota bacterium]